MGGLRKVEELTKELAAKHGLDIIGSFDPATVGCEAADYIDAEHANARCLGKLLAQFKAASPTVAAAQAPSDGDSPDAAPVAVASAAVPEHQAALLPQAAQPPLPISATSRSVAAAKPEAEGKPAKSAKAIAKSKSGAATSTAARPSGAAAAPAKSSTPRCKASANGQKGQRAKACAQLAGARAVVR